MKRIRKLLAVYVQAIVLALLLLNAQTASANPPPFYWEFINVLIDVQTNGDMLVTEIQKYVFTGPHSNERYRYIPLDKVDSIDQIEVFEGEKKLAAETNVKNGQRWIKWWHELNPPESHTFVLKYRVQGGIQIHDEEDRVYVKAIFKDRSAPIHSGKVTVRLPDALTGKISSFKSFGVPAEAEKIDERTVEFIANSALPPGKELEVRVAVPHGVLQLPEQPRKNSAYWKKKAAELKHYSSGKKSTWETDRSAWIVGIILAIIVFIIILIFGGKGGGGSGGSSGYTGSGYAGGGGFGGGSSGGGGGCCGGGGG